MGRMSGMPFSSPPGRHGMDTDGGEKIFPRTKRPWLVFLGCMILISGLIDVVFIRYRAKLEQEFYNMATVQLESYMTTQRLEVQSGIEHVDNDLQTMRMLMEASGADLDDEVLEQYMDRFNQENEFIMSYIPLEQLEADLSLPGSVSGDRDVYEQLKAGETVLSEIRHSRRRNGYFFGYGVPVKTQGKVTGVLRCIVDAAKLMDTKQTMTQNTLVATYIVKQDGTLAYAKIIDEDNEARIRPLLFEGGEDAGQTDGQTGGAEVLTVTEAFAGIIQNEKATEPLGKKDGMMTFVSGIPLGYNGWYLVNVCQASGLQNHTKIIMRNTVESSMVLMVLTIISGVIVYRVYAAQRRRISFESERYHLLAEFSDTVLMQYFYQWDYMVLTSNVTERFRVDYLEKERYLAEGSPSFHMSGNDWEAVRDALEHPCPKDEVRTVSFQAEDKDGVEHIWCLMQVRYLYEGNEATAAVGKITDISSQKKVEEKLVKQAQTDGLTGLLNKEAAEGKIARLMAAKQPGYLLMLDVDNFKRINDVYGHAQGDAVLTYLSGILKKVFRKEDVVGRIGGDEFVAFVHGDGGIRPQIAERAELILECIQDISLDGHAHATVSIGIAFGPGAGESYEELYMAADQAMYVAKRLGKNQYYIADE